jgi:flagellar motility protein MotE (MotC chaperone)
MKKLVFIFLILCFNSNIQADNNTTKSSIIVNNENDYIKQKEELISLKEELDNFYLTKEQEFIKHKIELEAIKQSIEIEKKEISSLKKQNEQILKEIQNKVAGKTTKVFNKMKPKIAGKIFNKMMTEGKEKVVFDIMIKIKEKQVTDIMKYLDIEYASILTNKLETYKKIKQTNR